MTDTVSRSIDLVEYQPVRVPRVELTHAEAAEITERWSTAVEVVYPSPLTDQHWVLTNQGHAGVLVLRSGRMLQLRPRVPIGNLFRMLEVAYDIPLPTTDALTGSNELPEFFDRLARILARRVLARTQRGLYRSYEGFREQLPYVRGSLDVRERVRRPWAVRLTCHYEEHTADVEENQILTYTLQRLTRNGTCSDDTRPWIDRAYRTLSHATLPPRDFTGRDCIDRLYNRLNHDYEPLHALCRFFLENTGPVHEHGHARMLPFLIGMPRLFERFVGRWMATHLPAEYELLEQENVNVDAAGALHAEIDLVLLDRDTQRCLAVLDTKYKVGPVMNADLYQVNAYADLKGTERGFLVYPHDGPRAQVAEIGGVRIRAVGFGLGDDLDEAGAEYLRRVLSAL